MVIWVLTEEPSEDVQAAIGIVERRLDSDLEVTWLVPGPVAETVQD